MDGSASERERDGDRDLHARNQLKGGLKKHLSIVVIRKTHYRTHPSEYKGRDEDEMRREDHEEVFRCVPQNRTQQTRNIKALGPPTC